ncbi:mechanosensitive ion channel family protein, partial [Treponema pallidum subsp. pallidum]
HIEHFNDLRNAIFVDIDECFKQAGIEVPFPHVDVRVQGACDAPRAETV